MQRWAIADETTRPAESQPAESLPAESLWQTVRGDFAAATGWKVLAIFGLLAWMAFQWGLGNDILLPSLAASALDAVDDGETWSSGLAAVAAAAVTGGLFWALVQCIDAVVMLSGIRLIPGLTARITAFVQRKGLVTPYAEMRWTTRWIISYATGVSLLCLVDVFATGRPGLRTRRSMIVVSVILSAGTVGLIVALVALAAVVAARIPATEAGAEVFVRFAKNPLTWIVIFVAVYGIGRLLSGDKDEEKQTENEDDGAGPPVSLPDG